MIGGLSPVSISISIKGVFPILLESVERMSLYSSHYSLKAFCCSYVTSASCKSTFLCMPISTGDVINFFSVYSNVISFFCSLSPSISLSSSNKMGGLSCNLRYIQRLTLHKTHNLSFRKVNTVWQKIDDYYGYILSLMYIYIMYHGNDI